MAKVAIEAKVTLRAPNVMDIFTNEKDVVSQLETVR